MSHKVNLITMGCSKNLVDSERVLKLLSNEGIEAVHNAINFSGGDVIINTCGFIGDAKEESINSILEACFDKKNGKVGRVFVMGCLSERYKEILPKEIPEVDGWFGKFNWEGVVSEIVTRKDKKIKAFPSWERKLTTPSHHAYIKIAEGCNRMCAFCAIPIITGRYKSRTIEDITSEVRHLASLGVKEFNIIAQDLSFYGRDIYLNTEKSPLRMLLEQLSDIEGVEWIRLHYAYPAGFPLDILPVMAEKSNICKYIDIALQHIDDRVLKNMQRNIDAENTCKLLDVIREAVPGIHIRTTLMVGFPGEDPGAFENLVKFVKDQKFERMGAFAYCEEEDTAAARRFADSIPEKIKTERLNKIMELQQEIALEHNLKKVGSTLKVIIDGETDEFYIGRTEFDSPDVDPEVLIKKSKDLLIGEFYNINIIEALPFELIGEVTDD